MYDLTRAPAFWGLCGALVYAAPKLAAVLFGETVADLRAVRRAWAQFAIAIFFGPVAAAGLGPTIGDWKLISARPEAVELLTGLLVNALWPAIETAAGVGLLTWLGAKLTEAGAAIGRKK